MPMSLAPAEPPMSAYGAPAPTTSPPSSYEPGWEPNNPGGPYPASPSGGGGGPYARVWTSSNNDAQNMAYSAYYPGASSTSTTRP